MKIELKKLSLINFKGIRSLTIDFFITTNIFGRNEAGKTTLMDAFLWLLFGKDSTDRKDFEIKTLDKNNQPFHKLDHEVSATILVDGEEISLRRVFREKWVTKRGDSNAVFSGHTTEFFWNDVPMKESEYQGKISSLLNENIFKLITNVTFFNSLKWQDRRAVLVQLAGNIDDRLVLESIGSQISFEPLLKALNQKKSMDDFRKEIAIKKKNIKDQLDLIPSRIDEANRSLPEEKDYSSIEESIESLKTDIENVDELLTSKSRAAKEHETNILNLMTSKQDLSRLASNIRMDIQNGIYARKNQRQQAISNEQAQLSRLNEELINARKDYKSSSDRRDMLIKEQDGLREKWNNTNNEKLEFKEGQFCCPTCKREYEAADVEAKKLELTNNFNADKSKRLNEITDRGKKLAEEISDLETKLGNLKAKGEDINSQIAIITSRIVNLQEEHERVLSNEAAEMESILSGNADYQKHIAAIASLEEQINAPYQPEDNSSLKQRKKELQDQLTELTKQLSTKDVRAKQLARIQELNDQEATMAQQLASLEGIEFSILQFEKAKMTELEKRVNGRFEIAQFKLFEQQINGGEVPCCETLIKGVPYADANTAAKIQCGLDIINVLNEHFGVYAPVWVDNRESVTELPETDSQLISLIVSPAHEELTVEAMKEMEVA